MKGKSLQNIRNSTVRKKVEKKNRLQILTVCSKILHVYFGREFFSFVVEFRKVEFYSYYVINYGYAKNHASTVGGAQQPALQFIQS